MKSVVGRAHALFLRSVGPRTLLLLLRPHDLHVFISMITFTSSAIPRVKAHWSRDILKIRDLG